MRKILAILLVTLMALSFVPFRNTKTVTAATNKNATFILNALQEVWQGAKLGTQKYLVTVNEDVYKFIDVNDDWLYVEGLDTLTASTDTPTLTNRFVAVTGSDCVSLVRPLNFFWGSDNELLTLPDGTKVKWDTTVIDNLPKPYFDNHFLYGTGLSFVDLKPLYAVDIYLTVNPAIGIPSKFTDKYTVVAVDLDPEETGIQWGFFFDKDGMFNNPQPSNNTMGPYVPGDDIYIEGRWFRIFLIGLTKQQGEFPVTCGYLFGMNEYLTASCCANENVYDYSVETDVEPAFWPCPLPNQPLARARLMSGTNPRGSVEGTIDTSKEIQQSTGDTKLGATTFHNIKVKTRSFLDLEIWRDVNRNGSDDYGTANVEEIIGVTNTTNYPTGANIAYFYDSLTGQYRYVLDLNGDNKLDGADYYLSPTSDSTPYAITTDNVPLYTTYVITGIVGSGDVNLTTSLYSFASAAVFDSTNAPNNIPTVKWIDGDGLVADGLNVGNHVVPAYAPFPPHYIIADKNGNYPYDRVTTIYGDYRAFDIPVMPGSLPVTVTFFDEAGNEVKPPFRVERTYTIKVTVDCDLPSIANLVAEVRVSGPLGASDIQDPIAVGKFNAGVKELIFHNVTLERGTKGWDNVRYSFPWFEIRVYADFYKVLDLGPHDGFYGYLDTSFTSEYHRFLNSQMFRYNRAPGSAVNSQYLMSDRYDCIARKRYNIDPEDLKIDKSKECISKLDQIFPNMSLKLYNIDNPDANDPYGYILGYSTTDNQKRDIELFAWVDASGGGILGLAVGYDTNDNLYILQINSDKTVFVFDWGDDGNMLFDDADTVTLLGTGSWADVNGNGVIDTSDWIDWNNNQVVDNDELQDLNGDYFPDTLEWNDINEDYQIDLPWEWQSRNKDSDVNTNGKIDSAEYVMLGNTKIWIVDAPLPARIREATESRGGWIDMVVLPPVSGCGDITLKAFTNLLLYNYCCPKPPEYLPDKSLFLVDYPWGFGGPDGWYRWPYFYTYQMDYYGETKVTSEKIYDYINFANFSIRDEGLNNSKFENPYPPYGGPNPPFSSAPDQEPSNLVWMMMELRSYPGGQWYLPGWGWGYDYQKNPDGGPIDSLNVVGLEFGFNSRHAQFKEIFWKLGTEFYPLTDYTFSFIVKDKDGNHLTFKSKNIDRIVIHGEKADPNAQPVFVWRPFDWYWDEDGDLILDEPILDGPYNYMGYSDKFETGLPVNYFVGDIIIKDGYAIVGGIQVPYDSEKTITNEPLLDAQVITGIIPTGPGIIHITVYDTEGHSLEYKYCTSCMDTPVGVPVHAVELTGFPSSLTVDTDNSMSITAKVYPYDEKTSPWGEVTVASKQTLANNVVIFVWQDVGIENPIDGKRYGVGDGWISGQQPKFNGNPIDILSGSTFNAGAVYNGIDWNADGKISFADHETEIVGTYDILTGSWSGGFVPFTAFTNLINAGTYNFQLSSAYGAQLSEIGFDFDSNNIILSNEVLPVRITAYSYGDDGTNPRQATKTAGMGWEPWEVYLAGQVDIPVVGVPDWNVETEPCLTAGVLPEAQPDGKPLTFMVTDADGNPVNLSKGVGGKTVNDTMIWNGLFYDVVPSVLPSYYWVRTDLHNNEYVVDPGTGLTHRLNATAANDMYTKMPYDWDGDGVAEVDTYNNALEPIKPDFSEKVDGIYKFNGFVANDKGEFEVRVYSPDRKHYATKKVVVELPNISYEIVNIEDEAGTVHTVPGDPDFVMTAGDLRIYKVTVTVLDCEDKPIGGPGKPIEECKPEEEGLYAGFLPYMGYTPHYYNWVGDDFNWDGIVDFDEWAPFAAYASGYDRIYPVSEVPKVKPPVKEVGGPKTWAQYMFYWGNGTYDGFMGQQGIFNSNYDIGPYAIGNMYPDVNQDGFIDIGDTWALDENGKATFYVEADDISALSGIVGKNPYVTILDTTGLANAWGLDDYLLGDVAGWALFGLSTPRTRFGSAYIGGYMIVGDPNIYPYGGDGGFYLDWYGNVDKKVDVNFMRFNILNGETHQELGKEIFNERYYDLTYGVENHIVVQALPADERDIAVRERVQIQLVGNVETWAYGTLMHNAEGVAETTLNFLPRGVGSRVAYLGVVTSWGSDMFWQHNDLFPWRVDFTSVGEPLYWTYEDRAPDNTMGCFDSQFTIAGSYVYYDFVGCYLSTPYGHDIEDQRKLTRLASPVGSSSWPLPYFDAGKGLALTLKGDLVVGVETEVTVKVTEAGPNFPVAGAEVTLYGAGVDLAGVTDADGVVKFPVKPTEAGEILITVAKDGYVPGKTVVVVGADTIAPELSVDKPVSPTNKPTVTITGMATDNAGVPMVMVNGVEATVGADGKFSAEVTLKEGENEIVVVAKDKSGNKTEKMVKVVLDTIPPEVTVIPPAGPLTSTKVKLTGYVEIGSTVLVNDKPATVASDDWEVELTLDYGENLVTVVATDAVGNERKVETTVVIFKKTALELQIGNPTPKVNGVYSDPLEAAPFIKDGRTMVPLRFIAEAFGAQVEWIPETKGINISLELKSAVHTIGLQVGNPTAIVDGQVVTLDVAPVIVNGRTFVPLRFIAEAFGATVDWNSLYQVVTINFLWY